MGTFLTDAAIAHLHDALSAFESPIPTHVVSYPRLAAAFYVA